MSVDSQTGETTQIGSGDEAIDAMIEPHPDYEHVVTLFGDKGIARFGVADDVATYLGSDLCPEWGRAAMRRLGTRVDR